MKPEPVQKPSSEELEDAIKCIKNSLLRKMDVIIDFSKLEKSSQRDDLLARIKIDEIIEYVLTQALEIANGDMVLVPREPTEDMYKAAHILQDDCAIKNYGGSPTPEDYWNTMIKAYEEGK